MPSDSHKKQLERSAQTYHEQLGEAFKSGTLPSGVASYLSSHAITTGIAQKYRLGYVADPYAADDRFRGMLSVPYLTPAGVVALKYRNVVGDGGGKYAQNHGQKGTLYNTEVYFTADMVIGICEGEMDAIAATEHLGVPSMGVPGANGWKTEWSQLFKDFRRVFVFGDGDQPGRDFAYNVAECIGWRAQIVKLPDGEDLSSLAASKSLDAITTSIREDA